MPILTGDSNRGGQVRKIGGSSVVVTGPSRNTNPIPYRPAYFTDKSDYKLSQSPLSGSMYGYYGLENVESGTPGYSSASTANSSTAWLNAMQSVLGLMPQAPAAAPRKAATVKAPSLGELRQMAALPGGDVGNALTRLLSSNGGYQAIDPTIGEAQGGDYGLNAAAETQARLLRTWGADSVAAAREAEIARGMGRSGIATAREYEAGRDVELMIQNELAKAAAEQGRLSQQVDIANAANRLAAAQANQQAQLAAQGWLGDYTLGVAGLQTERERSNMETWLQHAIANASNALRAAEINEQARQYDATYGLDRYRALADAILGAGNITNARYSTDISAMRAAADNGWQQELERQRLALEGQKYLLDYGNAQAAKRNAQLDRLAGLAEWIEPTIGSGRDAVPNPQYEYILRQLGLPVGGASGGGLPMPYTGR